MLAQRDALALVGGFHADAVELRRRRGQPLVDETPDDLAVLDHERQLKRAHLEHRARALPARVRIAETGIEEPGIVNAELPDQRVVRDHLRREHRRHLHRFARGENVEVRRVEHQSALAGREHRLPEILRLVVPHAVDVDQTRVALRLVADHTARAAAHQVHRHRHAVPDLFRRDRVDQLMFLLEPLERLVAGGRTAAPDPDLVQARAFAHQHAEGTRRYFHVQRPVVTLAHAIELGAVVGDEAREDVQAPGRALRVAQGRGALLQLETLEQRDDVHAAALEHRAAADVHLVHLEVGEPVLDLRVFPGEKARTHAPGDAPQAQVEARGLDLVGLDGLERDDLLRGLDEIFDVLRGKDTGGVGGRVGLAAGFAFPRLTQQVLRGTSDSQLVRPRHAMQPRALQWSQMMREPRRSGQARDDYFDARASFARSITVIDSRGTGRLTR